MLVLCILASCVLSTLSMEGFIVGGQYANIEKSPHSVLAIINCISRKSIFYICGASVINQDVLLSAAHCLHGCQVTSKIGVFAGSATIGSEAQRNSFAFMLHRNYSPITFANDIMLIIMDGPLDLNNKIRRVALMARPPYSEPAFVAGWGVVDEDLDTPPQRLKIVAQRVRSQAECNRWFDMEMIQGTICAAADDDEGAPARGDSGSALVVQEYIQIGIVSYKVPSVSRNIVIYTDVGYFFEWIKANTINMICVS